MTCKDHEERREAPPQGFTATYSPDDNKLRLYTDGMMPDSDLESVKSHGFIWAPKQEFWVAPRWTPEREDFLLSLCGEIEDEDVSHEERSADRADRFGDYRDKRRGEAHGHADTFDAGPAAFGHQNARRAERQASRHDRHRGRACSQWSKAEYWQERTAGVIRHAMHKSNPKVRRSRILRLETESRRCVAGGRWAAHYTLRLEYERAMLANEGGSVADVDMVVGGFIGSYQIHGLNKSNATGKVVSVKVYADEPWYRGEPVKRADGTFGAPRTLQSLNIQRFGEDAYRAPADEELATFKREKAERAQVAKATRKANPKPKLLNPTDADAERLMAALNARGKANHDANKGQYGADYEPAEVRRVTQAQYSEASGGSYSSLETRTVHNFGGIMARKSSNLWTSTGQAYNDALGPIVCKVRTWYASGWHTPNHLIILKDKPQKPLALDWEAVESGAAYVADDTAQVTT